MACQDVPDVYPGGSDQICDQWDWIIDVQTDSARTSARNPGRVRGGLADQNLVYRCAQTASKLFPGRHVLYVDYGAGLPRTAICTACPSRGPAHGRDARQSATRRGLATMDAGCGGGLRVHSAV
jgi:hypothetical protein